MGTRSLTIFYDKGIEIAVLYRQYDGSMEWHGKELAEFLKNKKIVNGFCEDQSNDYCNGMNCLTAMAIGHFKQGKIGSFYLFPAGTRGMDEEFIYTVKGDIENGIKIAVFDVIDNSKCFFFEGTPMELLESLETE